MMGMDVDIESAVKQCTICQETDHKPLRSPIHQWEITSSQWSRLYIDFAGSFHGKNLIIVVDSFSKRLEVKLMLLTTESATIYSLREMFNTDYIPDIVVSDNTAEFTSTEFSNFLTRNAIR